jgi:hypothetical protein
MPVAVHVTKFPPKHVQFSAQSPLNLAHTPDGPQGGVKSWHFGFQSTPNLLGNSSQCEQWPGRGREQPSKRTCTIRSRPSFSMARLCRHSMITLEMTAPTFQCGSKKSLMTGEGNVCTAPSPVASAPGELTLPRFGERHD